jgi:hypothetical protein
MANTRVTSARLEPVRGGAPVLDLRDAQEGLRGGLGKIFGGAITLGDGYDHVNIQARHRTAAISARWFGKGAHLKALRDGVGVVKNGRVTQKITRGKKQDLENGMVIRFTIDDNGTTRDFTYRQGEDTKPNQKKSPGRPPGRPPGRAPGRPPKR